MEGTERNERFAARLSSADKQLFLRAAAIRGGTLSEFVVSSAREAAERAVRDHDTITLTVAQTEAILNALVQPPEPTPYLHDALIEHGKRVHMR